MCIGKNTNKVNLGKQLHDYIKVKSVFLADKNWVIIEVYTRAQWESIAFGLIFSPTFNLVKLIGCNCSLACVNNNLRTTRFSLKSIPIVGTNRGLKCPSVYWYNKLVFPTPESPSAKNLIKYSLPWSSSSDIVKSPCWSQIIENYRRNLRSLSKISVSSFFVCL